MSGFSAMSEVLFVGRCHWKTQFRWVAMTLSLLVLLFAEGWVRFVNFKVLATAACPPNPEAGRGELPVVSCISRT